MKKNIGMPDRILRYTIGVIFLSLAWFFSSWVLLALALVSFLEGMISWCAVFAIFGKNSCKIDRK